MDYEKCTPTQKKFRLLIDEMKLKSWLVFRKTSGQLVGFVDLGSFEQLAFSMEDDMASPICKLAKQMMI